MRLIDRRTVVTLVIVLCLAAAFILYFTNRVNREDVPREQIHNAVYQDPSKALDVRVKDLLSQMTVDEKIGQLALVDREKMNDASDLAQYGIGGLLSGGGSNPDPNTPQAWLDMVNAFQRHAKESRLSIPILYGVDAVHGHTNVFGATIFPHAIGLAATKDADLVRKIGMATAEELEATGIFWSFSPSLDVVQDTRWGRTYETFGSDTHTVTDLGVAFIEGLQSGRFEEPRVYGTAKHFVGTGSMEWGTSGNRDYKIDQGVTNIDEATLREVHLPPFIEAVKVGTRIVMVGHAAWRGAEIAANRYLLTDVLKEELGFDGFVVSDWYGVYEIPGSHYENVVTAINAGVDMVMLPFDYKAFIEEMRQAISKGDITSQRLDDAVRRILRVKFELGLFDQPLIETVDMNKINSPEHRELAREAVRKSLVLLKNSGETLPLSPDVSSVLVAGSSAHNVGRQSGGWTIEWQGVDGNWLPGTTILDAIKDAVSPGTLVSYNAEGRFPRTHELADVGIAVVGEKPYAEGWGDEEHPQLSDEDLRAINELKKRARTLVVIIISGRPLDIREEIDSWDAVVAAWLPGSEGKGVTDVLFGVVPFVGVLPVKWDL